jgi:serine/threonine protein kinase
MIFVKFLKFDSQMSEKALSFSRNNPKFKVLIHMDIKPENFLYTKYDEDKLKIIDFGGSLLLPRGESSSSSSRSSNSASNADLPNYPMKVYTDNLSITDTYACPEMYTDFYDEKRKEYTVVTAKCDIWAVGIMIFEMSLSDVRYELVGEKNSDGVRIERSTPCVPKKLIFFLISKI